MRSFRLPKWQQRLVDQKLRRQDALASRFTRELDRYLGDVTDQVIDRIRDGSWLAPDTHQIEAIVQRFYESVLVDAWLQTENEDKVTRRELGARLAAMPKGKFPVIKPGFDRKFALRELVNLFRDSRQWPSIMKRSKVISMRMRSAYLKKLKRKFQDVVPKMLDGHISAQEAKAGLRQAWGASYGRVENIFRTETTRYFDDGQSAYYRAKGTDIIGYLFDSIHDTRRTLWCKTRHGLVYRPGTQLERENRPPCHWRCRSHRIALANTAENRKLLEDPRRDPSKVKVEPLPINWSR